MEFTRTLVLEEEEEVQCCFHRVKTPAGNMFFVSLVHQRHNYHFSIKECGRQWRIINGPELPPWILEKERTFEEWIREEE